MLSIKDLHVSVEDKAILRGLSLAVRPAKFTPLWGQTVRAKLIIGNACRARSYEVTGGTVSSKAKICLHCRRKIVQAKASLWPSSIRWRFQHSNQFFLQTALDAVRSYRGQETSTTALISDFDGRKNRSPEDAGKISNPLGKTLVFPAARKSATIFCKWRCWNRSYAFFDEFSDSGLDIDALKVVADGVNSLRDGKRSFIIVTHYQRILDYIKPDYVHVLYQGRIVKSGDFTLVKQLEEQGYGWLTEQQ